MGKVDQVGEGGGRADPWVGWPREGDGTGLADIGWIQMPVPNPGGLPRDPQVCASNFTSANLRSLIRMAVA